MKRGDGVCYLVMLLLLPQCRGFILTRVRSNRFYREALGQDDRWITFPALDLGTI